MRSRIRMSIITTTTAGMMASNNKIPSSSSVIVALAAEGLRDTGVVTVSIGASVIVKALLVDASREVDSTLLVVGGTSNVNEI